MSLKTPVQKKMAWKSIILIFAACFMLGIPHLAAQDYGGEREYQGQGQQGQQGQQQQYQEPSQPSADEFEDKELKKFAKAKSKVDEVRSEYSEAIRGVEEADKARELQEKYTEKMIDSIEEKDLNVEKYNQISAAMQNSQELKKKVDEMAE